MVAKLESTDTLNNQPTPIPQTSVRSPDNITGVHESEQENSRQSIQQSGFRSVPVQDTIDPGDNWVLEWWV